MSELTEIIRAEIALQGAIPFNRFMELSLYCPEYGFYERESETVGRRGDFYTSVSVGPLFGRLLAFQFSEWLAALPGGKLQLIEAGAHNGRLAADILGWLAESRPDLLSRLEYVILEPSQRRRSWQEERLVRFGQKVRWLGVPLESLEGAFNGIVFGNELLDAFPVRRLGWDARRHEWFEWGVTICGGEFQWCRLVGAIQVPELAFLPQELLALLPDQFTTEICPAAEAWWAAAARSLISGWLFTCDYGLAAEEFFAPHRTQGTLRAYQKHRSGAEILVAPGKQDITAHVNFSRIRNAGEAAGLTTRFFTSQAEFIMNIVRKFWAVAPTNEASGRAEVRELQTLTHPEHFGRSFRVLAQVRGSAAGLTDASVGHIG